VSGSWRPGLPARPNSCMFLADPKVANIGSLFPWPTVSVLGDQTLCWTSHGKFRSSRSEPAGGKRPVLPFGNPMNRAPERIGGTPDFTTADGKNPASPFTVGGSTKSFIVPEIFSVYRGGALLGGAKGRVEGAPISPCGEHMFLFRLLPSAYRIGPLGARRLPAASAPPTRRTPKKREQKNIYERIFIFPTRTVSPIH